MKKILITAIGSMSAECAIKQLRQQGDYVVGCDIYPGEWHYETRLCDKFIQAPYATDEDQYIRFLVDVCQQYELGYIIPLTDIEIDVINRQRNLFEKRNIVLCMQSTSVLDIARDKLKLSQLCETDANIPSVKTCKLSKIPVDFKFPCIAKPSNGRSSEGLLRNATREQVHAIADKDAYIVQEQLEGNVFTVDYCRKSKSGRSASVARQELLRTKNGAGLTVRTVADLELNQLVCHIGEKLNINGCVNMEFIMNDGKYYLIDINPRFSAGVAFSVVSGYNMVLNHMRCFCNEDIDEQIPVKEQIIIKKYEEII